MYSTVIIKYGTKNKQIGEIKKFLYPQNAFYYAMKRKNKLNARFFTIKIIKGENWLWKSITEI